jgi:dissimilatory sulfite reductase (desulfoviridin) alpha/beta subunit
MGRKVVRTTVERLRAWEALSRRRIGELVNRLGMTEVGQPVRSEAHQRDARREFAGQ